MVLGHHGPGISSTNTMLSDSQVLSSLQRCTRFAHRVLGCSPVKSLCNAVIPDQQAADGGASLPWGACWVEGGQQPGEGAAARARVRLCVPPHCGSARPPASRLETTRASSQGQQVIYSVQSLDGMSSFSAPEHRPPRLGARGMEGVQALLSSILDDHRASGSESNHN